MPAAEDAAASGSRSGCAEIKRDVLSVDHGFLGGHPMSRRVEWRLGATDDDGGHPRGSSRPPSPFFQSTSRGSPQASSSRREEQKRREEQAMHEIWAKWVT